jgi:hypothetical protein
LPASDKQTYEYEDNSSFTPSPFKVLAGSLRNMPPLALVGHRSLRALAMVFIAFYVALMSGTVLLAAALVAYGLFCAEKVALQVGAGVDRGGKAMDDHHTAMNIPYMRDS